MRIEMSRGSWVVALLSALLAHEAAADGPALSPPAPGTQYRLAVLDVKPGPGRQQAAALVVAAVHESVAADDRFTLVPVEEVARARSLWGEGVMVLTDEAKVGSGLDDGDASMSHTQACAIGHSAGAARLLLVSGYALDLEPSGTDAATPAPGQVSGGAGMAARLTATLTVLEIESCKVRERAVIRASRGSGASVEEVVAGARADFARSVTEGLQRLLPVHSGVRAVSRRGGEMDRGARHGVRPGQYFAVHRDARAVGHVYVEAVAEDGARVSLVRGASRLQPGDRLVEEGTVRIFEIGGSLTPNLLARNGADDAFGVATAVHVMTYQPVGSNLFALSFERLGLPDFSRWRGGIEIGRQVSIVPRRLFGYARVGLGLVRSQQDVVDAFGVADGGVMSGFELLNALGVKALFGEGLVIHASASMPFGLYNEAWFRKSNDKFEVPAEDLVYPSPFRALPTLTLGVGWRF
jgi:hypothetical protein